MAISGTWFELAAGDYRAVVSDVGAGLVGLRRGERVITPAWDAAALPPMSSGAVLLPWPNRLRGGHYSFAGTEQQLPLSEPKQHNASHGLVRWERFAIEQASAAELVASLDLVPQSGYPFELAIEIRYALSAETGLAVTTVVHNTGESAAPFGLGFHPYFDLGGHDLDHAQIDIPVGEMFQTDEHQIPTGRVPVAGTPYQLSPRRALGTLRLDHGFTALSGSRATIEVAGAVTELWWSEQFGYLQVFTPPLERFKTTAIAIEPMTCAANAFNSGDGLIELAAGSTWTAAWGVSAR
ncbi:aldose 1-epimerase family protein [Jatrophihabitans telluris]|uniref:Aldose 1-epimerase family protein n=1 Tax=Jatrophihabitans telluris TaxID=2038343 RepID=A0ABY4R1Y5_9ACTN|nr:aldose 1-epimerase family protein [Jatrophihabitans telluris]UQX89145.1 aldose 1-epimerase family protein [Jatrophihabitans telluris]